MSFGTYLYCTRSTIPRPGCINTMKGKRPRSPWGRNKEAKLDYCHRQLAIVRRWMKAETDDAEVVKYLQTTALFWARIRFIEDGQL